MNCFYFFKLTLHGPHRFLPNVPYELLPCDGGADPAEVFKDLNWGDYSPDGTEAVDTVVVEIPEDMTRANDGALLDIKSGKFLPVGTNKGDK